MMDFEAKDIIIDRITQGAMMYQQLQQLQMQVQQLSAALGAATSDDAATADVIRQRKEMINS